MSRAGLPVLTYHAIGTGRSVTETDPSWFAETLTRLHEAGYQAVDLEEWLARGRPDLPRAFAVAFDDGLRSILRVVDAVTRYRVPATVFLVSRRVGSDNAWPGQPSHVPVESLLDWSEIQALAAQGFRFGSHGETHANLDRLDTGRLEREIRGSRETIENRLGRPCPLLAYPYGSTSRQVRDVVSGRYSGAFGTRLAYADGSQDVFDLSRIDAYYLRSRSALDALVGSRARPWLRWRRALRAVKSRAGRSAG